MIPPRLKSLVGGGFFAATLGWHARAASFTDPTLQPAQLVQWSATDHYYQAVAAPNGITWYDAERWTWVRGGHLAMIDSAATNRFVLSLVKDLKYWMVNKSAGNADGPWLGGRHLNGSPSPAGGWRWLEGQPVIFSAWQPGSPRSQTNDEFCIFYHVTMNAGTDPTPAPVWDDRNGTTRLHGFVAEYLDKPDLDSAGKLVVIEARVKQLADDDAKAKQGAAPGPAQTGAQAPAKAAPSPAQTEAQLLTPDQMSGIVLISGSKGQATGFLSRIHNVEGVVTNLHVLEVMGDDQKLTVTGLNGGSVAVQGVIGAKGADIALLRLVTPTGRPPVLSLATDVFHSAKIGDKVVVVGNRQGAGVATQVNGQIDGIGPGRIEVNVPFEAGNSGSPVFDLTTKQVIGVATYNQVMLVEVFGNQAATTAKDDLGVRQGIRWFGHRIDSVASWETIDLTEWQRQLKRVEDFRRVCLALRSCAQAQYAAAKAGDPHLRSLIEKYEVLPNWVDLGTNTATTLSKPSTDLIRRLLQEVRAYAEQGVKEFGSADYYDYFHTCVYAGNNVGELEKFRKLEIKAFEEADTNFQSYQANLKP